MAASFSKKEIMMIVSGVLGVTFFVTANFTNIFMGLNIISGVIQISINIFVFVMWLRGFSESKGFMKFVAAWGVIVPVVLTSVTLYRVIIPALA